MFGETGVLEYVYQQLKIQEHLVIVVAEGAGDGVLDGVEYVLSRNAGRHHLHGGFHGLDKVLWEAEPLPAPALGVRFSHVSPDGTEGYPGRLAVSVTMALSSGGSTRLQ